MLDKGRMLEVREASLSPLVALGPGLVRSRGRRPSPRPEGLPTAMKGVYP
jgi:hypothetical protein